MVVTVAAALIDELTGRSGMHELDKGLRHRSK